jgi:hypothetical protein
MKWRIAALLFLAALPGVVATSWLAVPLLVDDVSHPVSLATLQVATAVQSAALVLAAALVGASLAPKTGLTAPAISAIASGGNVRGALRPQVVPGLVGGVAGAAVILGFSMFAPESLRIIQSETRLPLVVRVLYGGITEEVLVRWGLLTVLVWASWKVFGRELQQPTSGMIWAAIAVSALAFGASHLPSIALLSPILSAYVAAYVTAGNALFGLVAGYLFWHYGFEAAVIAHISAHLLAYAIGG